MSGGNAIVWSNTPNVKLVPPSFCLAIKSNTMEFKFPIRQAKSFGATVENSSGKLCPTPTLGIITQTDVRSSLALVIFRQPTSQFFPHPLSESRSSTSERNTTYRGEISKFGSAYSAAIVGGRPRPPRPLALPTRWYEPNL